MANSAPMTVIRKTAMAIMKLLIRRTCSRRGAAAGVVEGAQRGRVALHQTAWTFPFGCASPARPGPARLPRAVAAIITQLRASLDQDFVCGQACAVGSLRVAIAGPCLVR